MHVLTDELERISLPAHWASQASILTIGAFDGIHLGHQHLIRQMVAYGKQQNKLCGLVTFYPHPATILSARPAPLYLTTPGEKNILLETQHLDWTVILPFTQQLSKMPPREFIRHLYQQLNMRGLWISQDFALGHKRQGTPPTLQTLGDEMGFEVQVVPPLYYDGAKISSSRIRTMLRHGHVQKAATLLGRSYRIAGEVIHGAQRGRCIGFPTANVHILSSRVVPANGVYATWAHLGRNTYPAVTNIGTRPSFDNGAKSIEAHLIGFDQDIYGCDLVLEFVARLRPERRFPDVQALITQIRHDIAQAQHILQLALEQNLSRQTKSFSKEAASCSQPPSKSPL